MNQNHLFQHFSKKPKKPIPQFQAEDEMLIRQINEDFKEKPFPDTHRARDLSQKTF